MKYWEKSILIACALTLCPLTAQAYLGPGVGIGAVILTMAVGAGVLFLLFGLVWYPLKRLFAKSKPRDSEPI